MGNWFKRQPPDLYVAVALLVLAVGVARNAHDLGVGELRSPGPGFTYFWASVLLGLLALRLLIRSINGMRRDGDPLWRGRNWRGVVAILIALVVYAFTLELLGYILVTFVFSAFLFRVLADKRPAWHWILGGAALTSCVTYLVFGRLFALQLPKGVIQFV